MVSYQNHHADMVEHNPPCTNPWGSSVCVLVEARGIEPLSENSSSRPSPSADGLPSFPRAYASRQAYALGIP